ncbi:MAG: restriction endonuclease subunit S [Chloroflexus sp.]|uniref:restriction endonuclease subunit S n=1 Tax=Chloroflexus sp. TaxID=1904827 RepID=UPI0030B23110
MSIRVHSSFPAKRLKYVVKLRRSRALSNEARGPFIGLEHIESWTGKLAGDLLFVEEVNAFSSGDSDSLSNTFELDDVLFGKLRPYLAKVWIAEFAGRCTTEFLVMQSVSAEPRFLKYVFLRREFIDIVDAATFGSRMPRAEWDFIGNIEIPLPPLPQQRAIADYLDRETAKIDALIAAKQRLLALLAEKRRALITRAVTRGLDPTVPLRDSGIPWLGEIPAHWSLCHLKRVLENLDYGISAVIEPTGNVIVLRMGDIQDGEIDYRNVGFVDEVEERLLLRPRDLIFNRTNSLDQIGKVALFRGLADYPVSFASYLVRLRCSPRVLPEYLNWLLNSTFALAWGRAEALPAIGQAHLNPNRYGYLPIALPPIAEQHAIVEHIARETAKLDALRAAIERSIALLNERRAALIAAAVMGEIEVGVTHEAL